MENQQKAQATNTDAFQEKLPEYRFVHRYAKCFRIAFYLCVITCIIVAGMCGSIGMFFAMFITLLPFIIWFYFYSSRGLIIDQKSITYTGFLYFQKIRYQQIRMHSFTMAGFPKPVLREKFVLIGHYGHPHLLHDIDYVGVGHTLSLKEAMEQFAGPIKALDKAEAEKIPALVLFANVDKEIGHVAYATIGVGILFMVLALTLEPFHLLDHTFYPGFQWMVEIGVCAVAFWHMRHIKRNFVAFIFIPILLVFLGGLSGFMSKIFLSKLPDWFGEEEAVVFSVSEENEEEQRWTAITDSGLTFSILAPSEYRIFKGMGTEHSMRIYRGPGSLNALPDSEYRALLQKSGAQQSD